MQKAIENEINIIKTDLIPQSEIDKFTAKFISDLIYNQDDIVGQTKVIGILETNRLSYRLIDQLPSHFESVTSQDIKRVANQYFIRENLSILYLLPEENFTE